LAEPDIPPPLPPESAEELYEHAPCGYVTTRADGSIVRVNRTLLDWTGYARGELLSGRRFQDLLTVPGRIFYETHVAPLLRMQGSVNEVTFDLMLPGGSLLPVLVNLILLDTPGQPASIRIALVDVTHRRRYERELLLARQNAEQLAAVVSATSDAVMLLTGDGVIQSWNRGAERMFGYLAHEAIGCTPRELLVPSDRVEEFDRALQELRGGREVRLETVRQRRDGRRIDVSLTLTPHEEAFGELASISAIIRDMSESRRAEAELRRAERLRTVGTLAGGVAHEVNNQMTVVLGLGEFVRRDLGDDHPVAADIERIVEAATRTSRVSYQLLAFSQQQLLVPEVLDVHRVAHDLAPALERLLGPGRELVVDPHQALGRVRTDRTQLEHILADLVTNSRDAMAEGGRVTITTADVVLDPVRARERAGEEVEPGPYVLLELTDTGSGMDEATAARIFEPFFTTKAVGEGTGLGLSMIHGIVRQQGGRILVSTAPGKGTTVGIYLPAVPETTAAVTRPRSAAPQPAAVLVVEDEPAVRKLARRTLEAVGITVVEAESGRQAWELLQASSGPPELVLTDLVMPGMNGRELGEALARRWPGVPVLYTSAYPEPDMRLRGMLPEDAPFLQKPFTPDQVVERVNSLLQRADRQE
jgi:two-component system, cell cycle sensor histidine kinase and response regulator CckA